MARKAKQTKKSEIEYTGRFPTEQELKNPQIEGRAPTFIDNSRPFDPIYPDKKEPGRQAAIDADRICKTKDLKTFADAVNDILPFWKKYWYIYRNTVKNLTYEIHQKSQSLRGEYNDEHNSDIRPFPNDALLWQDWLTDFKRAKTETPKADTGKEIDPATKEQQWKDDAPEYIPNANAIKMSGNKISAPDLSKLLRKSGNTIRWMRNKETKRCKVHTQDFNRYIKNWNSPDEFGETVFKQRERQAEIDRQKRASGK